MPDRTPKAAINSATVPGSGTGATTMLCEAWPTAPAHCGIEDEQAAGADGQARPVEEGALFVTISVPLDHRPAAVAVGAAAEDQAARLQCGPVAATTMPPVPPMLPGYGQLGPSAGANEVDCPSTLAGPRLHRLRAADRHHGPRPCLAQIQRAAAGASV